MNAAAPGERPGGGSKDWTADAVHYSIIPEKSERLIRPRRDPARRRAGPAKRGGEHLLGIYRDEQLPAPGYTAPEGPPGGGSKDWTADAVHYSIIPEKPERSGWPRRDPARRRADPAKRVGNILTGIFHGEQLPSLGYTAPEGRPGGGSKDWTADAVHYRIIP